MKPIRVTYFSDLLCVWAYIAQVRIDELLTTFKDEVALEPHFVPIFGNAREKLASRWQERGGMQGYADHVHEVVKPYAHVSLNPETWAVCTPTSSLACHLFLCALRAAGRADPAAVPADACATVTWGLRTAFFGDALDVSKHQVQCAITESLGVPLGPIEAALESGAAHAELARDIELVREHSVTVSPTLIFNEGRQRLNGNVGYRVMEANIRELLRQPAEEHSWC